MYRKKIVQAGYNRIAEAYLASRDKHSADITLLDELDRRLPGGATVLDAGCGAGVPVTRYWSQRHRVVGIDFSEAQVRMARRLVPRAAFLCQDLAQMGFGRMTFDAIISYYAIIHVPRDLHQDIFRQMHTLLKPMGFALLCLGAEDLEEDIVEDYLGAPMYWSHFDIGTNVRLLRGCGFRMILSQVVEDASSPGSGHLFVLVQK
jgi:cyclopropane fatty-acyl-phospholipid synthase-like methyltransferase